MANTTDEGALHRLGYDPQNHIPPITRSSIHRSPYWNRHLFGVSVADLVPLAVSLSYISGTQGPMHTPSPFLCMLLKLLQLAPTTPEISVYLDQTHFKYPRILAAFYIRLMETPAAVHRLLEPLLSDYRKLVARSVDVAPFMPTVSTNGTFVIVHVDDIVDALLTQRELFGIPLPRLPPRPLLVETAQLSARKSALAL
ncbi:Pre-mRNA-splicing factor 38 [Gracilariopsis chorda]|uniref:Pre-mRNA-splicing factor 38 n=1 Tax=Gracilariopsis chorda TaxID=448386 RepID=A0A2V3ISM9_9FLOR|nr:Pre-mRNA-splicing factor 38 [Gracilariopsis chorda]|eukprot:PXF44110.1 Pre-mRNA-splicing factor 38 [Gracilariopsis chorda]